MHTLTRDEKYARLTEAHLTAQAHTERLEQALITRTSSVPDCGAIESHVWWMVHAKCGGMIGRQWIEQHDDTATTRLDPAGLWHGYQLRECLACDQWAVSDYALAHMTMIPAALAARLLT